MLLTNARGLSIMFNTMRLPENVKAYFQRQGRIGAAKRQEALSAERRSEIARKAANARWANQVKPSPVKNSEAKEGTK